MTEAAHNWHPLHAAEEQSPGVWHLIDTLGRPYAVLQLIEIGGERGYRAVTWSERSEDRELLGYFRTLRSTAMVAHQLWLASKMPQGFAPDPWWTDATRREHAR